MGVSLPALGEAFLKFTCEPDIMPADADRSPYDRWLDLHGRRKVETCWVDHHQPRAQMFTLAEKIRLAMSGKDFGATDALVLSCAVLCRDADKLYTTDKRMFEVPRHLLKRNGEGP